MISLDTSNAISRADGAALEKTMHEALDALGSLIERRGAGSEMLGWLDLPLAPEEEFGSLIGEGKRIQDENDCLVVIGIGGSYLGARAVIEALPFESSFPVHFAGNNLSPVYHQRMLSFLDDKRFTLCVISKSGTTIEPAVAFRLFRKKLEDRMGRDKAGKKIIAVTDPAGGALRRMAAAEGWKTFAIPPGVGGRFSVLSPVGLLPCAAAGIPIMPLMEGAADGLSRFTKIGMENIAVRYAAMRKLLYDSGICAEVLAVFDPEMSVFCEWWKQLAGESEGKNGKGLFPASAVMTTDLHSLGQLLQEGMRDLAETFLVSAAPPCDIRVPAERSDIDGLSYLEGTPLGEINRKAFEGTREAHSAGGLPNMTIEMHSIDPASIGSLILFFEVAISVSARLLGVNPFDQPGVEEYKNRMFRLLSRPGG